MDFCYAFDFTYTIDIIQEIEFVSKLLQNKPKDLSETMVVIEKNRLFLYRVIFWKAQVKRIKR